MSLKHTLVNGALVAALALGTGCVVRAHGQVAGPTVEYVEIEEEPPPPQVVVVPAPRPGYIWIAGRWEWRGGRYMWANGYWETDRPGYVYEQGHWDRRGRGHVWVQGTWRSGGAVRNDGPAVRDHRDNRRDNRRDDDNDQGRGPRVRDHR